MSKDFKGTFKKAANVWTAVQKLDEGQARGQERKRKDAIPTPRSRPDHYSSYPADAESPTTQAPNAGQQPNRNWYPSYNESSNVPQASTSPYQPYHQQQFQYQQHQYPGPGVNTSPHQPASSYPQHHYDSPTAPSYGNNQPTSWSPAASQTFNNSSTPAQSPCPQGYPQYLQYAQTVQHSAPQPLAPVHSPLAEQSYHPQYPPTSSGVHPTSPGQPYYPQHYSPPPPPANSPPANSPPANSPPANSPPANSPPANSPPANSPPANSPPANSPPSSYNPYPQYPPDDQRSSPR